MKINKKKLTEHGVSVVHDRGECKICDQIRVRWYDSANRTAHKMAEEVEYCRVQRRAELENTKRAVTLAGELHERIDELERYNIRLRAILNRAWYATNHSPDELIQDIHDEIDALDLGENER